MGFFHRLLDRPVTKTAHIRGNILAMLFGAVALTGALGAGYVTVMKGPATGVSAAGRVNDTHNQMMAATRLVVAGAPAQQDCDGDGVLEPRPHRAGAGPAGGGLLPVDAGAALQDGWKKDYGYCVWDHGKKSVSDNVADCGGSSAARLQGGDTRAEVVLAIISAGPNGVFETTCNAWTDADDDKIADAPLVNKPAGSDDIVHTATIDSLAASGLLQLQQQPDNACTPSSQGILRYQNAGMQVCGPHGWEEVGANVMTNGAFTPRTGAERNAMQDSNAISFNGFQGLKQVTVDGGAVILVNGTPMGPMADIKPGDNIAIRAPAAATLETTVSYTLRIGTIVRTWDITTRDRTNPALALTPTARTGMDVAALAFPATGANVTFTLRNTGEKPTGTLQAANLTNTTHFEFNTSGSFVGDNCAGKILQENETCIIDVRPKAEAIGSYSGKLGIADDVSLSAESNLSGTATVGCKKPWNNDIIPSGTSVRAYNTTSVPCGSTCPYQDRLCTNGVLGGTTTYNIQTCTVGACSYSWYQSGYGGCNTSCGYGTQTQTVYCRRSDGNSVSDSYCSGGRPASSISCYAGYSYYWTGYSVCKSNNSNTCTSGTQTRTCLRCDGSSASASSCGGSATASCSPACGVIASASCSKKGFDASIPEQCRGHCGGDNGCPSTWTHSPGAYYPGKCSRGTSNFVGGNTSYTCTGPIYY